MDVNLFVYLLFGLQIVGLAAAVLLGLKIARGPVKTVANRAQGLAESGKQVVETGKGLASVGARAKAIHENAMATREAIGIAPPPAGMILTPQRLLKGVGLARTARGVIKARALPKKAPSLGFKAAQKLGLIPPIAPLLFRAFGIGKTALSVARKTRK
ncbi:MAG: hypothetical protein QM758_20195 [Armatimonas sp.]